MTWNGLKEVKEEVIVLTSVKYQGHKVVAKSKSFLTDFYFIMYIFYEGVILIKIRSKAGLNYTSFKPRLNQDVTMV